MPPIERIPPNPMDANNIPPKTALIIMVTPIITRKATNK